MKPRQKEKILVYNNLSLLLTQFSSFLCCRLFGSVQTQCKLILGSLIITINDNLFLHSLIYSRPQMYTI